MNVLNAAWIGFGKVTKSPRLVLVVWLTVLVAALPAVVLMEETLRRDVGSSRVQEDLRGGLDLGWLEEFHHRQGALASTLTPGRVGSTLAFENIELWLSGGWLTENRLLAATGVVFLLIWILLQGGVIAHLSQSEARFRSSTFLGQAGTFYCRFLRIAAIMAVGYYGVYRLAFWLFPSIERWTRDVTVEKTVLGYHLAGAGAVVLLMTLVHLVADYAKIATVQEDRRSMVLAVGHSAWQVARHPLQAYGLIGLLSGLLVAIQCLFLVTMPDAANPSFASAIWAFGLGQVYLLARSALRMVRFGAEIALYNRWRGR